MAKKQTLTNFASLTRLARLPKIEMSSIRVALHILQGYSIRDAECKRNFDIDIPQTKSSGPTKLSIYALSSQIYACYLGFSAACLKYSWTLRAYSIECSGPENISTRMLQSVSPRLVWDALFLGKSNKKFFLANKKVRSTLAVLFGHAVSLAERGTADSEHAPNSSRKRSSENPRVSC